MSDNQILIHNAAYIITMDYERRIIKNGSILIENDRIAALGKMLDFSQLNVDKVINAQDMVITPGFVNGHCHISYAHATRGIFPDDLGNDYLVNVFRLQDSMSPKEELLTSLLAITELLSYGTTTIMDPGSTKHVDLCMDAYDESGIRLITGIQVTDRENPYRMAVYSHDDAIRTTESFITEYNGSLEGRVYAWAMPFSPEYVGGTLLRELKLLSDQLNVGSTLHVNNAGKFNSNVSTEPPVVALERHGFCGANVALAHCVGLSDQEIERMVKEAEENAEQEKKKRETIDARNQADGLIHQTEKNLKEHGDKVTKDDKAKIESDLEELEEALLTADIGWELTEIILETLKEADKEEINREERFQKCIEAYLKGVDNTRNLKMVIMLVGINGTGKTTSAAKLGGFYSNVGQSVSLVAADTYRAAAVAQIRIWAERLNLHLTANEKSSDPASVAYDGISSGMTKKFDRIIVDTSGRVHNSPNLMKELEKIYRVVLKLTDKVDVLITIDANTGQNGLQQVREFIKYIPLTGVILTKMDGTARGGIAIQIMKELNLPVYFLGVGEQVEDLIPFKLQSYIKGLIITEKEYVNE